MTNKQFDQLLRASAQMEEFTLSEHTENKLINVIRNPVSRNRVGRFTTRTLVIALICVLLLTAVAFAAANAPSIIELYERWFGSSETVDMLKKQTVQEKGDVYELPDIRITLTEVIFDGNTLYSTGLVEPIPEKNVVLLSSDYGPGSPFGVDQYRGATVPEGAISNQEKAAQTGARMVLCSVFVEAEGGSGSYMQDFMLHPDGTYSFVGEFPDVAIGDDGLIHVTLTALQYEVTEDFTEIDGTRAMKEWAFTVEALADELRTPEPAPEVTPMPEEMSKDALNVVGMSKDFDPAYEAFTQENTGAVINYIPSRSADNQTSDWKTMLMSGLADWDVMVTGYDAYKDTFDYLRKGGAADLSESEYISGQVANMYPRISEFLTKGGTLIGIPHWTSIQRYEMPRAELFAELGIDMSQPPRTLYELLDLFERYLDVDKDKRAGYVLLPESPIRALLTETAIRIQAALCRFEGKPLEYSTPEFRAVLERVNEVSKRIKDEEVQWVEGGSDRKVLLDQYAQSYALYEGAPVVIEADMSVVFVNPNSPRKEQAIRYVECVLENMDDWTKGEVYRLTGEDAEYKPAEGQSWYYPDASTDMTEEQYAQYEQWQRWYYSEYTAPNLFYEAHLPYFEDNALYQEYAVLLKRYYADDMGVEAFAAGLDALMRGR